MVEVFGDGPCRTPATFSQSDATKLACNSGSLQLLVLHETRAFSGVTSQWCEG